MKTTTTSEVLTAYPECPRKAYLLLYGNEKGTPHEYIQILQQRKDSNERDYINALRREHPDIRLYDADALQSGSSFVVICSFSQKMTARSITFLNCLTFPGQSYSVSRLTALPSNLVMCFPIDSLNCVRK